MGKTLGRKPTREGTQVNTLGPTLCVWFGCMTCVTSERRVYRVRSHDARVMYSRDVLDALGKG